MMTRYLFHFPWESTSSRTSPQPRQLTSILTSSSSWQGESSPFALERFPSSLPPSCQKPNDHNSLLCWVVIKDPITSPSRDLEHNPFGRKLPGKIERTKNERIATTHLRSQGEDDLNVSGNVKRNQELPLVFPQGK